MQLATTHIVSVPTRTRGTPIADFVVEQAAADEAAFIESVERIPIEALRGAVVVMQGQIEERGDGVVNRSGVHPDTV
jgi:hypothetical protein